MPDRQAILGDAGTAGSLNPAEWRTAQSEIRNGVGALHDQVPRRRKPPAVARKAGSGGSPLREEQARVREIIATSKEAVETAFADVKFGNKVDKAKLMPVVDAIAASVTRLPTALPGVTRMKERHEYTYMHSMAVCGLMVALSQELGLDPALTQEVGLAGLLHDVGKAAVPLSILDKAGSLDLDEYALVQKHTTRGYDLLRQSGIESDIVLDVCLHHHERVDGSGYPSGISSPNLSIHARMAAVCDVYDAVTSARAYKEAWSPGAANDWMAKTSGQFDARVLRVFRNLLGAFPVGTVVRLKSERLAVVVADAEDDPLSPDACVFMCAGRARPLEWTRVSTKTDPIIGTENIAIWRLPDWEQMRASMVRQFAEA